MWSSIPASMHFFRSISIASAVSAIIGICLLFSFSAEKGNDEAVAFEALARRLLQLLEKAVDQ